MVGLDWINSNMVMAAATVVLAFATVGLVWATVVLSRTTKQQFRWLKEDAEEKKRPDVRAFVRRMKGDLSMAHMELVIANVGLGVADGVRWWFDGVDKEDWKSRGVYGVGWPDCGRHSAGIEVLKPGDEETSHLVGGIRLVAPVGVNEGDHDKHTHLKPFRVLVEYTARGSSEVEKHCFEIDPEILYRSGGMVAGPLVEIATVLRKVAEKKWSVYHSRYPQHPDWGKPACDMERLKESIDS